VNKYFAIGGLIAFVLWSGFMYYEGLGKEDAVCGQNDAKHDLAQAGVTVAAEKAVIDTVAKQQTATQGIDHAYEKNKSLIDSQYAPGNHGVWDASIAASNSMSSTAPSTSRPHATTTRSFRTVVFKLNPEECDDNTEQLYGLQDWVRAQAAIKQPSTR